MSYPLVQEVLFERKIQKLHGVVLGVSCARPGVGLDDPHGSLPTQWILWFYEILHKPLAYAIPLWCHLFFHFYLFQWSFFDHFSPPFIFSLGLTFHSMLYLSLPDLILFPGIPYGFMFQWFRNKWESGQSFEGSSLHSALLLSWTQQRFVSLGNLELLWECRAVSVCHTEKDSCSVLWDAAVDAWKAVVSSGGCQDSTAFRIFSVKILYS